MKYKPLLGGCKLNSKKSEDKKQLKREECEGKKHLFIFCLLVRSYRITVNESICFSFFICEQLHDECNNEGFYILPHTVL